MSDLATLPVGNHSNAGQGLPDGSSSYPELEGCPVVTLEIGKLILGGSPRTEGESLEHASVLAGVHGALPPILVHRPTLRVIDGGHRIRAALLNGQHAIQAQLIECDDETAFVLAVRANITHGLPLSLADRKAAAATITRSHPHWSDRTVSRATGLSDKTVSAIRTGATSESPQSNTRIGKDGRFRPLNSADKRRQAAEMIGENPDASLREIARATGLSPATVRDVRQRTDKGEDPVPARYRDAGDGTTRAGNGADQAERRPLPESAGRPKPPVQATFVNPRELLAKLGSDPSMKFSESGRQMSGWLRHYALDPESCQFVATSIPDHWVTNIAELARSCAATWIMLAERLEERSGDDAEKGLWKGLEPIFR
jgi:ParB-like chromosome segregation protein Spo0J